jgi:hypothetical protein
MEHRPTEAGDDFPVSSNKPMLVQAGRIALNLLAPLSRAVYLF